MLTKVTNRQAMLKTLRKKIFIRKIAFYFANR